MFSNYDGKVTCNIEFITPDTAAKYLENNNSNRSLSKGKVAQYARDMAAGNWVLNGETICFFENGELKDGQHRLLAITLCGVGQWMIVVRGISKNAVIHDRGRLRSAANVMELAGYDAGKRNNSVIGAVTILHSAARGVSSWQRITDSELMEIVDQFGDYFASAYNLTLQGANRPPMKKSGAIAAIVCALYCGMNPSKIEEFCRIVNTGFCDSETKFSAVIARNVVLTTSGQNMNDRIALFRTILLALNDFDRQVVRKRAYTVIKQHEWEMKTLNAMFPN